MTATDAFSPHMEVVARHLLGEPNKMMSSATELRFGSHGSMSVDLEKGVWADHEAANGGGVLDLIQREKSLPKSDAAKYLKEALGIDLPDTRPLLTTKAPKRIVATYDYVDEDGEVVLQVVRYEPKAFAQRRPDPNSRDGWSWTGKGVRALPYRCPEIFNLEARGTVFLVEGEKDADKLAGLGLVATCNAGGSGKWTDEHSDHLVGLDVVIIPDNDDAGRRHADLCAVSLRGRANSVRILDLPGLPAKGDVSQWIEAGHDRAALEAAVAIQARVWTPAPPASRFGAIHWADLDTVQIRQDWLVDELFFCGDMVLTYGASGSGKSFLAVDMGLSIARGVPFLGKETRKGAVIYQAGEGGKGLLKRMKAYRQEHRVAGTLPFVLLPDRVNLFGPDGDVQAFIEECLAQKAYLPEPLALIVIDTFSTASPGANENTSEDMGRMLAAGHELQERTGAAVMWVHHKNAAGDRERGHSSLRANSDSALEVSKEEETGNRTLRVVKVKDGEDGEKIGFELQSVQIGTYDDGKPMTSCVVRPAQVGEQRTSAFKPRLSLGSQKFLKILDDAIVQRGGRLPQTQPYPADAFGVDWGHFSDIYKAVAGFGIADNALRQALHRDGGKLLVDGMIDRHEHLIWITDRGYRELRT